MPFCKDCAERYLRVKKKLQGDGHPGPGPANWREGNIVDEFHKWQQHRSQQGQLGIGGDKDLEDFAREKGVGGRGIEHLRKQLLGAYQPGDGWKRLYDERRRDHRRNQKSNPFPWPPKKKDKDNKDAMPKAAARKQAWSGWGPTAARKHHVDGWEWDQRLAAYVATSTPDHFMCKCGAKLSVPGYHNCKCGKIWNSYVIGTGGENRQAAVEKFLCREVPVRDNVIVANNRTATGPVMPPKGLTLAPTAPGKDKPVVLVYGGGFNPAHMGHVGALKDAYTTLANAGYNVDHIDVVPTADKLLANKLGPQDRLDLMARAHVSRAAFPKDINGVPVEIQTEPSEIVEHMQGKPRRTDLANWALQHYPGHTVVNVTGEDAIVPGAPNQFPALYAGAPGTNHQGYHYLTMPRDMVAGLSSTKIRNAIAAGQPVPGMSPEAEQAYREELARLRAAYGRTGNCKCWKGYERVPGTKPCAPGSCRKCDGHRKKSAKNTCPACGMGIRDYDLNGITDHKGQKWCKGCLPEGIKKQMESERKHGRRRVAEAEEDDLRRPTNPAYPAGGGGFSMDVDPLKIPFGSAGVGGKGGGGGGSPTHVQMAGTPGVGGMGEFAEPGGEDPARPAAEAVHNYHSFSEAYGNHGGGEAIATGPSSQPDTGAPNMGHMTATPFIARRRSSNIFDAVSTRADGDEDHDFATDEWPSDHHPGLKDKLKSMPKDWHRRDVNQRWTAR